MLATDDLIRVFALGRIVHPVMIEMFGLAGGYHGFWLDQEHAQISTEQITVATLAARANQFDTFVRIPPTGYWQVTQCLEAGAGGIMGAQIYTAEQAREFASWAKFAPRGTRGLNTGGRDGDYSHKPAAQLVEDANRNSFVAIQIETAKSVEQVDDIAAIESVDLLFVGPADLSLALGVVGDFHHDKLWEAIQCVAAACQKHGKGWGCVVPDPKFAERAVTHGCRMTTIGNDPITLKRGIEALQSSYSALF
jgi:2-dehydro-3-deoxyglucarate aldolase/4-hydroxy-2-oxoheptanedioate aldolase